MSYNCTVCGMEKTESIPASGEGSGSGDGGGNGEGSGGGEGDGGTPSVSGNDNPGGGSVSGNDNPGGEPSVPGNDNPGGEDPSVPGNDNPGSESGGSPSVPDSGNESVPPGGEILQPPTDNQVDPVLLWNSLPVDAPRDAEPRTSDSGILELYATVAMIAGFFYLLLLFLDKYDISEEKRRESLARLVRWAKCGGWSRKLPVMVVLFVMRAYYRAMDGRGAKQKNN